MSRPRLHPSFSVAVAVAMAAVGMVLQTAAANAYPERTIRYIIPFAPGGGQDVVARQIAPRLSERLGQQVIVDNRPGGGATVGAEIAAKSAPDGYVIFMASNTTHAINPNLYEKLAYDPIRDFFAVSQIASLANILVVHPSLPARNVRELVALAKGRPGELNFGSSGNGTPAQLAGVMFGQAAGIKIVHVPYKGSNPALTALLSGETQMMFGSMPSAIPFMKIGKLNALAVTSAKRSSAVPEVPTVAESGFRGFEATTWYGIAVPAGVSNEIVTRLHAETVRILNASDFRKSLLAQGAEPVGSSPEDFMSFMKSELIKYKKIVKDSGLRPD